MMAKVETGFITKISNNFQLFIELYTEGVWVRDGTVHPGQKIRYGGINSLRGYSEDFFQSNWIVIPNLELQYVSDKTDNYFLFFNSAIQDQYSPYPHGYGFGITQVRKNTVVNLIYGIGRDDKLSDGKIHVSFITRI
jgi:hypothetical protein